MKHSLNSQRGFIILLWLLVLILGAAAWLGSAGSLRSQAMQMDSQQVHMHELQRIKNKMLSYAMLQPEIFRTDTSGNLNATDEIPGPGYFPCPDTDNDGVSDAPCGTGVNFVLGRVPLQISSRRFSFISQPEFAHLYWYAVDARFVVENLDYNNLGGQPFKRYAPLNISDPATPTAGLTLDGTGNNDIVMILFYAGRPLAGQAQNLAAVSNYLEGGNADGDINFVSVASNPNSFNDAVLTITRDEWNAAILSRVSSDADSDFEPDLCASAPAAGTAHWFNDCVNIYGDDGHCSYDSFATDNQVGQGWRTLLGCP